MSLNPACIRFDSVYQATGGWVSVQGKEAERFEDISQVDSDFISVSNLGFQEVFKTGLSANSKIRISSYLDADFYSIKYRDERKKQEEKGATFLKEAPNDMISHFGIEVDDWEKQVEVASGVFDRIYSLAEDSVGFKVPPSFELRKGIRQELMGHDTVIDDMTLLEALEASTTHYSLVARPMDAVQFDVDFGMTVSVPKATHALDILSKPLPKFGTKWKRLSKKVSSDRASAYIESLDPKGIYLFRVNVKSVDESMADIINYGTGGNSRRWVTSIEARFLAKYAKFDIYQGFEALSVIEHDPMFEALDKAFNREQHDFSYSAGLFLQNVWSGLSTAQKPLAHILKENESYNFYTPFLKAYDKFALIEKVKCLMDQDILVSLYGKGDIKIILKDYQLEPNELFNKFEKANVIPYGLNLKLDSSKINQENPLSILRQLYMSGDTDSIVELDKQLFNHLMK